MVQRGVVENEPTLDEASVKLFRVVLLPEEGFPTNPIKGSRPMLWDFGCGLDIADVLQSLRSTIVPAVSRATPPLLATVQYSTHQACGCKICRV